MNDLLVMFVYTFAPHATQSRRASGAASKFGVSGISGGPDWSKVFFRGFRGGARFFSHRWPFFPPMSARAFSFKSLSMRAAYTHTSKSNAGPCIYDNLCSTAVLMTGVGGGRSGDAPSIVSGLSRSKGAGE